MNKKIMLFVLAALTIMSSVFSGAYAQEDVVFFDYSAEKMPCEVVSAEVLSPKALENIKILGKVTESDWQIGPEDAPLTIIEYSDFQCPYCSGASLRLMEYQSKHPDQVRLVYRHFPLSFHEKAVIAASAVNAAGDQGMFFDAAEYLFENQAEWSGLADNNAFSTWLIDKFSKFSDLDFNKWYLAFTDNDRVREVQDTYNQVLETGIIGGTPTIFVNYIQTTDISDEYLDKELQKLTLSNYAMKECPDVVIEEGKDNQAVIETEVGDIHVSLFSDTAPMAVNNFVFLAESGWYDNNEILKKQDGFMVQTGDPTNSMTGYPGYYFVTEYNENHLFDGAGYLGMANSGRDKNGSQFFITDDIKNYYVESLKENAAAMDISEDDVEEYASEKIVKFSKAYTLFGKVAEEDLDLIDRLNEGVLIKTIKITAAD